LAAADDDGLTITLHKIKEIQKGIEVTCEFTLAAHHLWCLQANDIISCRYYDDDGIVCDKESAPLTFSRDFRLGALLYGEPRHSVQVIRLHPPVNAKCFVLIYGTLETPKVTIRASLASGLPLVWAKKA
jgi:hypothetical protein